ncbi:type II toxin-antitoxin system Phd/YefM family antitoxin [Azospirillum halopraeferens]|uniref:type II toxin-antitoxin system Phd/YefM family antitoxin n=1 Tax=Azospirillum halopraeferens TaxID=34010 RepID=UPI00041141C1|nr:type II toxin-antitoxin system prevent-host-death family antitoxin [Azospirillum halopraeferens]
MTESIPLDAAEGHLAEPVERTVGGEDIVLTRNGRPAARIVPMTPDAPVVRQPKRLGLARGRIRIAEDFDETPQWLVDAFEASKAHRTT